MTAYYQLLQRDLAERLSAAWGWLMLAYAA
jgi:hypothetical protein